MRSKTQKQDAAEKKYFIVMNSKLEYFCGLAYGGECVWNSDYREAKPLDDEAKFRTLKSLTYGEELLLDYI